MFAFLLINGISTNVYTKSLKIVIIIIGYAINYFVGYKGNNPKKKNLIQIRVKP